MEAKCTLSNEELIKKSFEWVKKLADTGGSAWTLRVPVDFNNDPDILFCELGNRLKESEIIEHGIIEGSENWKAEYDNCRALLQELVDLKIMKENLYKGNPDGKEYAERKPKAWEAAKAFLSTYQHEGW